MRVLVTGAAGQLGRALLGSSPNDAQVIGLSRADCDICDASAVAACVEASAPDVIVNAAAYTLVDKAESEPAKADQVNVQGVRVLAQAAARRSIRLLHVSTDFVFDGRASSPYRTDSPAFPVNVYGTTKLQGEAAAKSVPDLRLSILRTSWVYDATGRNFLTTMLRLMRERGRVEVVADQIGSPTAAISVAQAIWRLTARPDVAGTFHWTDAGIASWYDFAVAIADDAMERGLLRQPVEVIPISTSGYPTAARRPAFSVLDKESTAAMLELKPTHWRRRLREVLGGMANE